MVERRKFDYFLLRYVPNVVREEFVNIGLIMTESGGDGGGFAGVHFTEGLAAGATLWGLISMSRCWRPWDGRWNSDLQDVRPSGQSCYME